MKRVCDLRRHFIQAHDNAECPEVHSVLCKERDGLFTRKERNQLFDLYRKQGIEMVNKQILTAGGKSEDLISERKSKSTAKVVCSKCRGTFAENYFERHAKTCYIKIGSAHAAPVEERPVDQIDMDNESFEEKVVRGMVKDDIKDLILNDPEIIHVGHSIFAMTKPNKIKDGITSTRTAMKRLGKLSKIMCLPVKKIFKVQNLPVIENTLKKIGHKKPGLKLAYGALIKRCCKILSPHYICNNERSVSVEVDEFLKVFSSTVIYSKNFSAAEHAIKEKRMTKNRHPEALPEDYQFDSLMTYLREEICKDSSDSISKSKGFIKKRRLLHAYLTMMNGRRGNEVSQITLDNWKARDTWYPKAINESDQDLIDRYSVLFIMGKNDQVLPIFVPRICENGLNDLADNTTRIKAGVMPTNRFLFPYTQESEFQVTGYHEIKAICEQIQIPVISATTNRHRISTGFWQLEGVSEEQVTAFLEHVGHSAKIDKNIYACPLPLKAARNVLPILEKINSKVRFKNLSIFILNWFVWRNIDIT